MKLIALVFLFMVATIQSAHSENNVDQKFLFQLTKGKGIRVCDAYLKRLNTTDFKKPPFCGRPENDAVDGFALLNRAPLSPVEVRDVAPIIWEFWSSANDTNMHWNDTQLQEHIVKSGQFRLTDEGEKIMKMYMDRGWSKIWGYIPPIDIDNDGMPDNVEIWHGASLPNGVAGRECGANSDIGDTLMHQPQIAFVITNDNKWLDVAKTENIFSHPKGGYPVVLYGKETVSDRFRPIGTSIGIFEYRGIYYFDTFFDSWGDFQGKRRHDHNISNTLGVFLNKDGKTAQVCEFLATERRESKVR